VVVVVVVRKCRSLLDGLMEDKKLKESLSLYTSICLHLFASTCFRNGVCVCVCVRKVNAPCHGVRHVRGD
jgi:hypothetical protein